MTGISQKRSLLKVTILKVDKKIISNPIEEYSDDESYSVSSGVNNTAYNIISLAYNQIGAPYVWGATGPDTFDCSGFMSYIYSEYGIYLPRVAAAQYYAGINISMDELQAADLVFFDTYTILGHVGMYIGGGKFIHAADNGVTISSLYEEYYLNTYSGATRVIY